MSVFMLSNYRVASGVRRGDAVFLVHAANCHDALVAALESADRLIREALPKFNWGASALDANAIRLLNEVPSKVSAALAAARGEVAR